MTICDRCGCIGNKVLTWQLGARGTSPNTMDYSKLGYVPGEWLIDLCPKCFAALEEGLGELFDRMTTTDWTLERVLKT